MRYTRFNLPHKRISRKEHYISTTGLKYILGASSGFGAAIAHEFASQGAQVINADLNPPSTSTASHPAISFHQTNVTASASWASLLETVLSKHQRIDILVNNAGTSYPNKPTLEVTEQDFDKCFTVNVKSIFLSVGAVVPHFLKQGTGGVVINIASIGATRPRPGLVWYNASKGAVANVCCRPHLLFTSAPVRFVPADDDREDSDFESRRQKV
jgi:NAD(P)-dependent dehydrogenase (short-subunit alcohol dehydrogenase family)